MMRISFRSVLLFLAGSLTVVGLSIPAGAARPEGNGRAVVGPRLVAHLGSAYCTELLGMKSYITNATMVSVVQTNAMNWNKILDDIGAYPLGGAGVNGLEEVACGDIIQLGEGSHTAAQMENLYGDVEDAIAVAVLGYKQTVSQTFFSGQAGVQAAIKSKWGTQIYNDEQLLLDSQDN
jgi:hypothetical protein